jgi:hypothetical protein
MVGGGSGIGDRERGAMLKYHLAAGFTTHGEGRRKDAVDAGGGC